MPNALVVEDDRAALRALSALIEKRGFSTAIASNAAEARRELGRSSFDVVLIDVNLPDSSGIDLLLEIPGEQRPCVVLMSGDESVRSAFDTLPMQEMQFLRKPIEASALDEILRQMRRKAKSARAVHSEHPSERVLLGESPAIRRVHQLISKVAPTELSVYLEGESGTGKELVAQSIHQGSPRADGPFVAVNCGALPENLIDSELFGYEKGAFTGADKSRTGVFEQADGGTLFLDEISEMPAELQVRLLRTLETGKVRRVGGKEEIAVDVRIVSATNRPFDEAIEQGCLREDLFHRVCVFPIVLPPLRERGDDVARIGRAFLDRLGAQELQFDEETLQVLRAYDWPGNVRQLKNAMQRAAVLAEGGVVRPRDLPEQVVAAAGERRHLAVEPAARAEVAEEPGDQGRISVTIGSSIAEVERRLIEKTIESTDGDKRSAAEILGVSLRTLYNRLNDYASQDDGEPQ